jgi:putative addiction module killer protein
MDEERRLVYCKDERGRSHFSSWLSSLKDKKTRARIQNKVRQLRVGNFSNCKSVGGAVHELKINFGPGYRVYFAPEGEEIIVLIGGGDKSTQEVDIENAKSRYRRYKENG